MVYLYGVMPDKCYQLFVYGSLRSGFKHPAYAYISNFFTLVGEASVPGCLYDMGEYPAAIPSEAGCMIKGELYHITNTDQFGWAIAQLDDYEGVHPDDGETPHYRRAITKVFCNGVETTAWIYWFNLSIEGCPLIESGDVLEYLFRKNNS